MMKKKCNHCKESKDLKSFYSAPSDGAASWAGTSMYCITCHDNGLIYKGYGCPSFNGKYKTMHESI